MKLPIGFGTRFVFRTLLPGTALASVMARLVHSIAFAYGAKIPIAISFIGEIAFWGWIVLLLDMPIYMIFEGRRWWPLRLAAFFRDLERRRLLRILKDFRHQEEILRRSKELPPSNRIARDRHDAILAINARARNERIESSRLMGESVNKLNDFPLDPRTAMFTATWPTKLGNLIAAYEQYPLLKYRMDAVFFWPRVWITLDKDLRDEIDTQQAMVDGTLYTTAVLIFGSGMFLLYAGIDSMWPNALMYREHYLKDLFAAAACATASYGIYSISLHAHSKFGDMFKATFDQYRSKVDLDDIVVFVGDTSGDPSLPHRSLLERNRAAYRFLQWQRVRRPGESKNRRVRT
jgi:hypothetical protein